MKIRAFLLFLCLTVLAMSSCNDDLSLVGGSIRPDGDVTIVTVDTFTITASTIKLDSIYARTINSTLGEFYDPLYGKLKSDYICQFYCEEGFKFRYEPFEGRIESVRLEIFYASSIGDTLTPMRAEVFPVEKALPRHFYTNFNPADFANLNSSLGGKTYTAYDMSVSDSIRGLSSSDSLYYVPKVTIDLPTSLGQAFYDESVNNPASFANQPAFNNYFPGLYITNTFGTGNVLNVDGTRMIISYMTDQLTMKGSNGQDSTYMGRANEVFLVTNEVIQLTRLENSDIEELLAPNDDHAFLKTPAGVLTRIVIPTTEIFSKTENNIVNKFQFTLKATPQPEWKYALAPPTNLLIMPEDSLTNFFENRRSEDYTTIFPASYSDAYSYDFGNISSLLRAQKDNAPDEDLRLVVVPVERIISQDSHGNILNSSISNYLVPSGVTLRKDGDHMKIQVVTSRYAD